MPRKKNTANVQPKADVQAPVQEAPEEAVEQAPVQAEAPKQEAPKPAPVRRGNGTVAVALNHPLGLTFKLPGRRTVTLNGSAAHLRGREKGVLPTGAYGLTVISEADWEYIKAHYGSMRVFRAGLCFARDSQSDARAMADERKELRHGFEAADPMRGATRPASTGEA